MGLGDQTGEQHLRIRARSPTGSVAGAASYVNGLSAQGANRGLPHLRSPTEAPASDTSDAKHATGRTATASAPTILIPVCQAGHGYCGVLLDPCLGVGVGWGHREEAMDVACEVTLETA